MNRDKFLILSVLFISAVSGYAQEKDLVKQIPAEIDGWSKTQEDRNFNEETLYDYIDGGAELYISFGFSKVVNRIYSKSNQPDIIVDVFYMNSSYDAYGAFSHSVGKIGNEFGNQSQTSEGAILFWKGNFYISILAYPETNESKSARLKLAKIISDLIVDAGDYPPIISKLPGEGLIPESIRYFRHYIWLNSHGFVSNENILNISQETECVIAQYANVNKKANLLIIEYINEEEAKMAAINFKRSFNSRMTSTDKFQDENKLLSGIEQLDKYIIGIFQCTNENFFEELLLLAKSTINK